MQIDWTREEIILACDLVSRNAWRGLGPDTAEVTSLSRLLNASLLHPVETRDPKFRNPNGVSRKTWDIATQHPTYEGKPTKGNRLDLVVLSSFIDDETYWQAVASRIRAELSQSTINLGPLIGLENEDSAEEGQLLLASHYRRERNPRLRRRKLASVEEQGGAIECEVCSFNFSLTYGERGLGYIEVHHVLPLHISEATRTRLSDLALLCANCHRMIHRGEWITPVALKKLISTPAPQQ